MTGAYFRIKSGPEWANVELDQMTPGQIEQVCRNSQEPGELGVRLAKFLADWILEHIKDLEEEEVGVIERLKVEHPDDPLWSWNAVGYLVDWLQSNTWAEVGGGNGQQER